MMEAIEMNKILRAEFKKKIASGEIVLPEGATVKVRKGYHVYYVQILVSGGADGWHTEPHWNGVPGLKQTSEFATNLGAQLDAVFLAACDAASERTDYLEVNVAVESEFGGTSSIGPVRFKKDHNFG